MITVFGNKAGIVLPVDKVLRFHNAPQVVDVCFYTGNFIFIQNTSHPFDGILPSSSPDNELANHRVIVNRYFIPLVCITVNAHPDAVGLN